VSTGSGSGEEAGRFDVLALPGLGRFLKWRHARTALALPLFLVAALMIFDGFVGPQLAPKNLATVLTWVHYRGVVVFVLLLAGNLFCTACPFMLVRNGVRRLLPQAWQRRLRPWPRRLRGKWLSAALFALLLFAYELFDLWAAPLWTAALIAAYFIGAVVVDSLFAGFAFCKHVCPLGQFNFLASTLSPLEVKARDLSICAACPTKDCITGRQESNKPQVTSDRESSTRLARGNPRSKIQTRKSIPGCQTWLFQPAKVGNVDCTFCLDCVHACPYDNVGIVARMPGEELGIDPRRSGIGRFSRRVDLAALAVLFTFGALLNAFAMVTPVYALEQWLADLLGTTSEFLVLAILFAFSLGVIPALLLGTATFLSTRLSQSPIPNLQSLISHAVHFAYALIPLGFGVWLAHYSFHFLTGFWTFVPVIQSFVADLAGAAILGAPNWRLASLVPEVWLYPLELGFLGLGWFGSLLVAYQVAAREAPARRWQVVLPWGVLVTVLLLFAIWLMGQPMEMRGTFLAG
jgi:ferredoxin